MPSTALERAPFIPGAPHTEEPRALLDWVVRTFGRRAALVSSMGPQTLAILQMLHDAGHRLPVLLLDTELLCCETYALREQIEQRYDLRIRLVRPAQSLEAQAQTWGDALWERDRERCCRLRKVEPLAEALQDYEAWLTGLRRDQGPTRAGTRSICWDARFGLWKVCPLASWTRPQLRAYLREHGVPVNPLLERGYGSVGCWPCSARVDDPDHERAGRWAGTSRCGGECGIHLQSLTQEPRS